MLLNLSNHPLNKWEAAQVEAALPYGEVRDIVFPKIPPEANTDQVIALVNEYVRTTIQQFDLEEQINPSAVNAVHIMGEFTFVFHFVTEMKKRGVQCLCSTTERISTDNPDGTKTILFKFVKFREY